MPSSGLVSCPLLPPKGQLMMKHSTPVLPVLLLSIVVLLASSSCEARGLPVHGNIRSSSKSHRLPGKDMAATSLKADGWLSRQMEASRHMMADQQVKEGVKMAAASAGAVRATPTPAFTFSQRLSRREETGFHLDYDGPRTHTPSHN